MCGKYCEMCGKYFTISTDLKMRKFYHSHKMKIVSFAKKKYFNFHEESYVYCLFTQEKSLVGIVKSFLKKCLQNQLIRVTSLFTQKKSLTKAGVVKRVENILPEPLS